MTAAIVLQVALLLHQHQLTLHLVTPSRAVEENLPLIVYATGDGGWKRKDLHTFDEMRSWGYPIAGFSSPDYLKHLGRGVKTLSLPELAADFNAIIRSAKAGLGLAANHPVVLVGVSRGADLVVAVAGQSLVHSQLAGVVAVALTNDEEYLQMSDLYGYLPSLGALPVAVVQSTHDSYVPAPLARKLFGNDTDRRRLQPVDAKNHNFSDARSSMYMALHDSLIWLMNFDTMVQQ